MSTASAGTHNSLLVAWSLLRAGNVEEGIRKFAEIVSNHPNDAECHRALGAAYAEAGRKEQAEMPLRRALRLAPDHVVALRELSTLLFSDSRYGHALPFLKRYAVLNGNSFHAHYNLGLAHRHLGDPFEAIRSLARAAEITRDHPVLYHHLGCAYKEMGRFEEACLALQRSTELATTNPDAWCDLGDCYAMTGRPHLAAGAFTFALGLARRSLRAMEGLARARMDEGSFLLAAQDFMSSIEIDSTRADLWCCLGNAYFAAGRLALSQGAYSAALEKNPQSAEALKGAGAVLLAQAAPDAACGRLLEAINHDARLTTAIYLLALAYLKSGRVEEAVTRCQQAIEEDTDLYTRVKNLDAALAGTAPHSVDTTRLLAEIGATLAPGLIELIRLAAEDRHWQPRLLLRRTAS